MQVTPYFTFDGNCTEALDFYVAVFQGQIVHVSHFEGSPAEAMTAQKNRVLHAQFASPLVNFMASDSGDDNWKVTRGNNLHLSIDFKDAAEQERVFAALSDEGAVSMPLQDTFWGARFGMVTDRFGINWMLNHDYNQQ